jgi:dTDP-glucose 4,6-dehydratase
MIAILGSNSFSGAHLVNYLLENTDHEIIGISRSKEYNPVFLPYLYKKEKAKRYKFCQLDLNKDLNEILSILDLHKPEYIVNFAAQGEVRTSWEHPTQWYNTNCIALVNLTNELKEKKYLKRFIQASTPEVYGSCPGLIKENYSYKPSTPYAASKAAADLFLIALNKSCSFPVVLTRASNVYGMHQQLYRIIPRTIIYLKTGKKLQLHGHGLAKRDFIHITDVCSAILKIIESENPSLIYHLSSNEGIRSIASVVKLICDTVGYDIEKFTELVGSPKGQDSIYELDSSLAENELNWKPAIDFKDGIKEVANWVEENWDLIKDQPFEYIHKE